MTYTLKTQKNNANVEEFIESIEDEQRKKDSKEILEWFKKTTKEEPKMWGSSIVGFGKYHYKYKSGQEGDWFIVGFSPRKAYLALYVVPYLEEQEKLIKNLGTFKAGKSCINVKKLEDIDLKVFEKIVKLSFKTQEKKS